MFSIETSTNSAVDIRNKVNQIEKKGLRLVQIIPYSTFTAFLCEQTTPPMKVKETVSLPDEAKLIGRE